MSNGTLYRVAGLAAVDRNGRFIGFATLPQRSGNPEDLRRELETLILPTGFRPYGKCFMAVDGSE